MPEEAIPTAQRSAVHQQDPVEMVPQTMSNADNRPSVDVVVCKSARASIPPKYLAECSHEEMTCHVLRTRTSLYHYRH